MGPQLTDLKQTLIRAAHEESQATSAYWNARQLNFEAVRDQRRAEEKVKTLKRESAREKWGRAAAAANQLRGETEEGLRHATIARDSAKKKRSTVAEQIREAEAVLNSLEKSELSAMMEVICIMKGSANAACRFIILAAGTGFKFSYQGFPEKLGGVVGSWNSTNWNHPKNKRKKDLIRKAYMVCLSEL